MSCRTRGCAALACVLAACTDCPPDYHVITAMRVMGTAADPLVATPGATVTLRVLTADVEARDVVVDWYRCAQPLQVVPVVLGAGVPESLGDLAAAQVRRCLAGGAFAHGTSVRVPIDADGGLRDAVPYRPARRWTDLVGFACAGGSIEAPPEGGLWPRCTGTRGVLFTASIPGPLPDGTNPAPQPATLRGFTFGPADGAARPWGEGDAPEVPACEGARGSCPAWDVRFDAANAALAMEPTSAAGILGTPGDDVVSLGYHVTGAAPARTDACVPADFEARIVTESTSSRLRWVPPAASGDVTFWFTARRYSGGLTVTRRTVRVR